MKYVLLLNDMRSSNIENLQAVAYGERQQLIDYHESMKVPAYNDKNWQKVFRQGSALEWFNPGRFNQDAEYFGGVYPVKDDVSEEEAMQIRISKW